MLGVSMCSVYGNGRMTALALPAADLARRGLVAVRTKQRRQHLLEVCARLLQLHPVPRPLVQLDRCAVLGLRGARSVEQPLLLVIRLYQRYLFLAAPGQTQITQR